MGFPKYISQKETKIFHTKAGYDIKYGKERAEKEGRIHTERYFFSRANEGFFLGGGGGLGGERREDFFSRGYVKERGFSGRREVTEAFKS